MVSILKTCQSGSGLESERCLWKSCPAYLSNKLILVRISKMSTRCSADPSRPIIPRAAKSNAQLKLPYLNDCNAERAAESSEEGILNFFGCYSDSKIKTALKRMSTDNEEEANEAQYNVDSNHPWGKRLRQLNGFNFTHDIRLAPSKIHGFGLFAYSQINKHEIIMEYTGERITKQQSEEREAKYLRQGINESYFAALDEDHVIDGTFSANVSKYINHSCNPNSILEVIQVDGVKRIVVTSKRRIRRKEELTYDYMFEDEEDKLPCLCKSARCRGFVNLVAEP